MTQFQPPSELPGTPLGNAGEVAGLRTGNEPWSASSVAGFICSLLGCLAVPAVLGLILGIVGIVRTKGGKRKGRGLAIASIPISVASGGLAVVMSLNFLMFWPALKIMKDPLALMDKNASAESMAPFRALTTEAFDKSVDPERWNAWLEGISSKHGKLVAIEAFKDRPEQVGKNAIAFSVPGKFVNGRSNIVFTLKNEGWKYVIDDVAVDGVSPRGPD